MKVQLAKKHAKFYIINATKICTEIGMGRIREKSLKLTGYMIDLFSDQLDSYGFVVRNPLDEMKRGGHILLEHPEAARICKALKAEGVIPDFRAPNGIRLAPVALYNSFEDVWRTVQIIKDIMDEEKYKQYENKRGVVA